MKPQYFLAHTNNYIKATFKSSEDIDAMSFAEIVKYIHEVRLVCTLATQPRYVTHCAFKYLNKRAYRRISRAFDAI